MASHINGWRHAGVFFDDVAVRFADGSGGRVPWTPSSSEAAPEGIATPTENSGVEEFVMAAPLPGCARGGLWDGKAEPVVLYRLFLDSRGPFN